MPQLLVASYNLKKLKELQELLADLPITLLSLNDFPSAQEVEENGSTFQENAVKKAVGYVKQTGCLTLAEDSGLTVDFLNGAPGVLSARFSGIDKNDLKNCEKVLNLLKGVPKIKRGAAFRSAVALAEPPRNQTGFGTAQPSNRSDLRAEPSGVLCVVEESVSGFIADGMTGANGFGYDPLFFYPEFGTTFGNISPEKKHSVSHRGKALGKIKEFLKEYLKKTWARTDFH